MSKNGNPTSSVTPITDADDRKPAKRRYMRCVYTVIVEVDEGDFAAAQRAQEALEEVAEDVVLKRSHVVRRDA